MKFIQKFPCSESHYSRVKTKRAYLTSNLNISKLHELYNKQCEVNERVNYKFFSRIFNNKFNIGFGSPATDICSLCTRRKLEIKLAKDESVKANLTTDLKVHKLRAKQFYSLMKEAKKERKSEVGYCFDLQQVQALPKVPIQEAYYARQLSFYCFCVCKLKGDTPYFYTWTEDEAGRGPNEISSALANFLSDMDLEGISTVSLFADGCGGQNKNSRVLHTLMVWLFNDAPECMQSIVLHFPVRGHSYLPADAVFGQVDAKIRKIDTILTKEKYWDIYSQFGVVKKIDVDWQLFDVKGLSVSLKKLTGIQEFKRIFIKKFKTRDQGIVIKVKGVPFYRNDDETQQFNTLLKKRCIFRRLALKTIQIGRSLPKEKIRDLNNLLQKYGGENWESVEDLKWYKNVLQNAVDDVQNEEEEEQCDCEEEDKGVKL